MSGRFGNLLPCRSSLISSPEETSLTANASKQYFKGARYCSQRSAAGIDAKLTKNPANWNEDKSDEKRRYESKMITNSHLEQVESIKSKGKLRVAFHEEEKSLHSRHKDRTTSLSDCGSQEQVPHGHTD